MDGLTINKLGEHEAYKFDIDMLPIQAVREYQDGWKEELYNVPVNMGRALVRRDTGKVLGVHKSKYKPILHNDVVNKVMESVDQSGIISEYKLQPPTVQIDTYSNGAKLRGSILFNDLVIEPKLNDAVAFRINFFNSYDATWTFQAVTDALRIWCLNGCTNPHGITSSRFKHTTNVSLEGVGAKIQTGIKYFLGLEDTYKEWSSTRVEHDQAERYFKSTLCKTFKRGTTSKNYNELQLEELLKLFDIEKRTLGNTKWGLYNAVTYWATHTKHTNLIHPANTTKMREDMIAKSLTHESWLQLT